MTRLRVATQPTIQQFDIPIVKWAAVPARRKRPNRRRYRTVHRTSTLSPQRMASSLPGAFFRDDQMPYKTSCHQSKAIPVTTALPRNSFAESRSTGIPITKNACPSAPSNAMLDKAAQVRAFRLAEIATSSGSVLGSVLRYQTVNQAVTTASPAIVLKCCRTRNNVSRPSRGKGTCCCRNVECRGHQEPECVKESQNM